MFAFHCIRFGNSRKDLPDPSVYFLVLRNLQDRPSGFARLYLPQHHEDNPREPDLLDTQAVKVHV